MRAHFFVDHNDANSKISKTQKAPYIKKLLI